jgi:hypothetical protein
MMKFTSVLICILCCSTANSLDKKPAKDVNLGELVREVQLFVGSSERQVNVVWWVPVEYWETAFSQNSESNSFDIQEITKLMNPYFMLAVVQSDISPFGVFNYYSKEKVSQGMSVGIINANGDTSRVLPLPDLEITEDMNLLLENLKPMLRSAMGNLGGNFHFFVFSDRNEDGTRKMDPYKSGKMEVHLESSGGNVLEGNFETPLNSLFIPRVCPNGKPAHVSWKYCPWTGEKLPD